MAYFDSTYHDPYDLTILYMEDAREWCEYLFDLFQPYDVHQNSEDITTFPTQEATLDAIQTSQVRIIIISPTFVERCTAELERCVTAKSVVGLLCGVTRSELHSLELRVPSYKQWELIEAQSDAKDLTQVTMKMLQDSMKEFDEDIDSENDGNSLYMPMQGNVLVTPKEEDLYVQGTQEEDLYVQGTQEEDLYVAGSQDMYAYDDLKTATVFPRRIHVKKQKNFYVSFSYEALEKGSKYLIKVTGADGSTHTDGVAQNPYVLCVNTPEDIAAGHITMEITSQGQTMAIKCEATLVTHMDEVSENLKNALEPMNFICESLGISRASSNDLDNLLFGHIKNFQDNMMLKNALTTSQVGKQTKSDKLYPTALHFAANFGLKAVTNYLVGLPGADHALKVKNRDNYTPYDLAKRNGHEDISDSMSYPTESPTGVSTNQGYVKMIGKLAPPGYQIPRSTDKDEMHRILDSGNIYDVFYPTVMTRIEDEDHSQNYEPLESDAPIVGPALPNPIIPALPPHVTQQAELPELPEFKKELWDIDQRMKNQQITQEEAHQEFENWRVKYMSKTTITTQKPGKPDFQKHKKGPFGLGRTTKPVNDSPREQRTQSTISRPILSSSHSVPQSTSTPSYLRAVSVPGTSVLDIGPVQPPPTRQQPDPPLVRQRNPLKPPVTNNDKSIRRRSSGHGHHRLSFPDPSDYQPPNRDPPPIPSSAQRPPPRARRGPIPAPRP